MKFLRGFISIMMVCGLLAGNATAAEKATAQPVVVDVRSQQEWLTGHLEGAVLIPHEQIVEGIAKVTSDKKAKILLYCRSGRRTAIAIDELKKNGYENLINLGSIENASKELGRAIVK
ncbi:rhodanese-like domain-containing protein [Pelotalea chapellei]|uniref:Rhodanese-like domain-containing protein n=1 Tax=Pelotalea chapellei TaxID=44671 RepID=A0ABS5UBS8_9BACT|nr:rhodanese-like domain-containing protein [Pelotalea chapellei]MBT1073132.1 rhodanese-like domain-containing protein [Pelotalea chapellei]